MAITAQDMMYRSPPRVGPHEPVQRVVELLRNLNIGAVLITIDRDLTGIFTERDILRHVAEARPGWRELPISQWMTHDPIAVAPDTPYEEAMHIMEQRRFRHLPVVETGTRHLLGIVSARGLIAGQAARLDRLVAQRTAELRRANESLLARDLEMTQYMKIAGRLQKKMILPHAPPTWPEVGFGIHYAPLEPLGGDFYDFARPSPDELGVLIADACGHGIPAAMVAIMGRQTFVEVCARSSSPGEVLGEMNTRLQDLSEDRFVTACYAVLDRGTGVLKYANAGHQFPLHLAAEEGRVTALSARGFMLGIVPNETYAEGVVHLRPGDRVVFYTDGVTDCLDPRGDSWGTRRLEIAFAETGGMTPAEATRHLLRRLGEFRDGVRANDDISLVVMGWK